MLEMRTLAIAVAATWAFVIQSLCLSRGFTQLHCANTAERIDVLLEVETL